MTTTTDDLNRRDHLTNLFHDRADRYGLARVAVRDAAAAFASAGGALSTGAAGAYLPSGASLDSWISDQRETAPHWFAPPEPQAVTDDTTDKSKPTAAERRARATVRLARENGDDEVQL